VNSEVKRKWLFTNENTPRLRGGGGIAATGIEHPSESSRKAVSPPQRGTKSGTPAAISMPSLPPRLSQIGEGLADVGRGHSGRHLGACEGVSISSAAPPADRCSIDLKSRAEEARLFKFSVGIIESLIGVSHEIHCIDRGGDHGVGDRLAEAIDCLDLRADHLDAAVDRTN
jgi:hypothetical protein